MAIYDIVSLVTLPFHIIAVYLLCNSFMPEKEGRKIYETISYVLYGVLIALIFLWVRIPFIVLVVNLFLIFLISLNYEYSNRVRCLHTIVVYSILIFAEIIPLGIVGFFQIKPFSVSEFDSIFGIVLVRIVTFLVAICVYRFYKGKKREYLLPKAYDFAHIFILIGTLYLFVIALNSHSLSLMQMTIGCIILMIVNGMILYTDEKLYTTMVFYTEQKTMKLQSDAYRNQNEMIRQSQSNIQSLKHDMKNHLIALGAMYEKEIPKGVQSYITEMMQQIDGSEKYLHSNNFVVDSIVNFKLQEVCTRKIAFKFNVKIPSELNISDYDLTVILGNLLDNAIEALQAMPNEQEGIFSLDMQMNKGSLIVFMDNSYVKPVRMLDGIYQTTKVDSKNHGIGIQSIENTLAKYDGDIKIEHTESVFSVSVLIPFADVYE